MRRVVFIYNPLSGDRSVVNKLDYIIDRFQQKNVLIHPFRIDFNNLEMLTGLIQNNHFDYAVISGGDGTLNSIVNIILKISPELPVGIIPSGTSNDLARCLNIKPAISDCLDVILNGNSKAIDVGLIDDSRYFLSSCAGGLFVDAAFDTDSELKKNFGPLAYYVKALGDVVNVKPVKLKITTENKVYQEDVLLFIILNGKNAGGFTNIIKEADFEDGVMDIILIKNCSHIDLASLFFNVLSDNTLSDQNVVKIRASECVLECGGKMKFSIDGEDGGKLPRKIRFIRQLLHVFVP